MAKTPPFSVCYQYCVGGGGENPGAKAVQSDYAQNDSSKLDYIKNRPFYKDDDGKAHPIAEEFIPKSIARIESVVQADYNQNDETKPEYIKNRPFYESITEIGTTTTDSSVGQSVVSFDIDSLAVGDNICYEVTCDGNTTKGSFILEDCVDMPKSAGNNYSYMWNDNGFISLIDVCDGTCDSHVRLYRLDGVKQLDEKFIPDSVKYAYESEKIGEGMAGEGGMPEEVYMSYEAGLLEQGDTLLIKDTLNGVTTESTVEVPLIKPGYLTDFEVDSPNITRMQFLGNVAINFQGCTIGTKIEVYKLNKKPISEATTELYGIVKEIDEALDRVIEKYGLGGFVMPEGAFAIESGMSIEAGTYKFVAFIAEDGTVYEEIPENGSINGATGSSVASLSSNEIKSNTNWIVSNDGVAMGYTTISYTDGSGKYYEGTTYVVKVG